MRQEHLLGQMKVFPERGAAFLSALLERMRLDDGSSCQHSLIVALLYSQLKRIIVSRRRFFL